MSRLPSLSLALRRIGALLVSPMMLLGAGQELLVVRATGPTTGTLEFQGHRYACALGKHGIAAEGEKREGDGKTPAGIFPLRNLYVRPDKVAQVETGLAVTALAKDDGWCDAPADPHYNQPVKLPFAASHEDLWREQDDLYDLIVPIGYNDDPVVPGRGSAIFMHVARPGYLPTAGCVALSKADFLQLLKSLRPGCRIQILAAH